MYNMRWPYDGNNKYYFLGKAQYYKFYFVIIKNAIVKAIIDDIND